MKVFREIFGRIWAAWAMIAFIGTMLIFFIPFFLFAYFLPEPKKTHRFILFSRIWMTVFLNLIGCPLKKTGLHHFKNGKASIVVCNHNSFMDIPISSPAIPSGNKTIAKVEMSRVPLFGILYKTGSVLVDRKSDLSRKESYVKMKQVLQMAQLQYIRQNPAEFADFDIPWSVSLSYSLNFYRRLKADYTGYETEVNSNLSWNGDFNLTPRWKMGMNGYYDFKTSSIQTLTMFISREMHCWQLSINVTPVGLYRSFNITINPKSGLLRDLKINRTRYFYAQ